MMIYCFVEGWIKNIRQVLLIWLLALFTYKQTQFIEFHNETQTNIYISA